jgi:hypothetical protein
MMYFKGMDSTKKNNVLSFAGRECAFRVHGNLEHKSQSASAASNSVTI